MLTVNKSSKSYAIIEQKAGSNLAMQGISGLLVFPFTTMAEATYTNPLFACANAIAAAGKTEYPPVCNLLPNQTWKDGFGANMLMYAQGQMEWDAVVAAAVESWATEAAYTNMANGY